MPDNVYDAIAALHTFNGAQSAKALREIDRDNDDILYQSLQICEKYRKIAKQIARLSCDMDAR